MSYFCYRPSFFKSSFDVGIRYETSALAMDLVTVYGQTVDFETTKNDNYDDKMTIRSDSCIKLM